MSSIGAFAAGESMRLAVIQDMSKAYGLIGELQLKGVKMAFDAVGNEVLGRQIGIVVEGTGGGPAVALSKARKTLATFKPHFVTGPIEASILMWATRSL